MGIRVQEFCAGAGNAKLGVELDAAAFILAAFRVAADEAGIAAILQLVRGLPLRYIYVLYCR